MDDVLERGTRYLNGHTAETDSTVLLLLEKGKNRRLLAEVIRGDRSVRTSWTDLHDGAVDLVVTDARHLERHWDVLRERKFARSEVFFPILLVSADERVADLQHRYFELVDEVLTVPLSRAELRLRLNVLDRARGYSETAARRNEELSQINGLLAEREARLATLATAVDQAPDHIFITDAEGTIEFVNEAFEKDLGYSSEEVVGRTMREIVEEMNELKSAFLANMSHEIRTPLASIIGFADLLAERAPEPLHEFVDLIRTSGERLLVTLNSVLDLAQLESGSMVLRPEEMNVGEVLREVTDTLRPQAQKSGIHIELDRPKTDVSGVQDRGVLTRIVTNLVHNGIKFTKEGEVRLIVRVEDDSIVIRVKDSGIGIDPKEVPHLFQAFRQESRGLERKFDGSGLGLTITKELVDHVGGEISVASEKGTGTTFTVVLPRDVEQVEEEGKSLESAHQWGTNALPPDQRVLAVDDDEAILEILGEMLPDSYQIDAVTTPEQALKLASETEYDLVLLDINLKDELNGVDVLDRLRETNGVSEALMIAVTAYALPGDGENFHDAGFDGYVSKPFTQETLRENLIQVL